MGIESIERLHRGESFYYSVGSYATVDRGKGIETVGVTEIIETEKTYVLKDENNKKILEVDKTVDTMVTMK